ncbi:TetR/AcrR family transcriptional regulator [Litoreibacter roseus]|uniref:TetR family transcriptional regulator n=1 Tax=Litoreibacter roseus TaxID=2601869 RepID=A0A6N6JIS1_9RHOB|nr:TetR/AcrR family transcriptional regulator [Litoreibacter roseus]GFE65730.1 TetR family transcriptional regulator [Litoreibacter roseus]
MARPRSYEQDEVIARVRDAFWECGYQGLGIRAIEEQTGLGRFAIRTVFGGKEGLMAEAMRVYTQDTETYVLAPMRARDDVDALVEMLEGMVAPHPETRRHFGCLMVNTSIENASLGSEMLGNAVATHFGALRTEVVALTERGQAAGRIRADLDPATCAEFVVGSVMATMVLNRAAADASGGAAYVSEAVRTIRSWSA